MTQANQTQRDIRLAICEEIMKGASDDAASRVTQIDRCAGAQVATQSREVPSEVEAISVGLEKLLDRVELLEKRLDQVLLPDVPEKGSMGLNSVSKTYLGGRMADHAGRVSHVTMRVQSIIDRLEL